ncbi:MAG: FecR domain-containing protein [Bacteroidetes bacterium]|nr:FecR domain-containing protein [Bacteroidota bacterium]
MENSVDKHILFESFSGRSTPLRKKQIEDWLREPENIERYYEWLDEWERTNPQFMPDTATALVNIAQDHPVSSQTIPTARRPKTLVSLRFIAAAIATIALITAIYALKNIFLYRSMSTAYGETRSVVLPDGSLVSMNANTTVRYSRFGFGKTNRDVFLSGEADFTVTHSGSQPFTVNTDKDLKVLVLGTRFTVYTRGGKATVVLREGKVQLQYKEEKKERRIELQPGDLFTAKKGRTTNVRHIANPENLSAWKDHEFLFDATSLSELAGMIRDNFGLSVHFDNEALSNRSISGSFHADTANELLDVIAQLLNIHYTIREGTVYFSE